MTGADATTSGATRVAGTTNYKRKYEPEFPTVTIRDIAPGKIMTADQLEALQLVEPSKPVTILQSAPPSISLRSETTMRARKWLEDTRETEDRYSNRTGR